MNIKLLIFSKSLPIYRLKYQLKCPLPLVLQFPYLGNSQVDECVKENLVPVCPIALSLVSGTGLYLGDIEMKGVVSEIQLKQNMQGPLVHFWKADAGRESRFPSDGLAVGKDSCHPSQVHGSLPINSGWLLTHLSHVILVTGSRCTLASLNVTDFQRLRRV